MSRYFIEVAYKGTHYSGFQIQQNANTIQSEIEKAFSILHQAPVHLTGSSRTDTGVHALQNYFHFDYEAAINKAFVYKMNAILPKDVVVKQLLEMPDGAHARFDAVKRAYEYRIYTFKNPFLRETAYYYPYTIDIDLMNKAAELLLTQNNFFAFSKTNTQVNNFNCTIYKSVWQQQNDILVYNIEANRFLRGMVRLLTATLLKVGRGQLSIMEFISFFKSDNNKCGYSVPATGLFLKEVIYPKGYFKQ